MVTYSILNFVSVGLKWLNKIMKTSLLIIIFKKQNKKSNGLTKFEHHSDLQEVKMAHELIARGNIKHGLHSGVEIKFKPNICTLNWNTTVFFTLTVNLPIVNYISLSWGFMFVNILCYSSNIGGGKHSPHENGLIYQNFPRWWPAECVRNYNWDSLRLGSENV